MQENPYEPEEGVPYYYDDPDTVPIRTRTHFIRRFLAWLPLAFFAACMVTALIAQPLTRAVAPMPVTGSRALPPAPTLTPGTNRAERFVPPQPDEAQPGLSLPYKEIITTSISDCTIAFHEFFILERMAVNRPEMIISETWREEAQAALHVFQQGCAQLGTLPDAPSAYVEADRWLKLAAGEIDTVSLRFDALMDDNDADQITLISTHMMKFLEYTRNAEIIIERLEERKEI